MEGEKNLVMCNKITQMDSKIKKRKRHVFLYISDHRGVVQRLTKWWFGEDSYR